MMNHDIMLGYMVFGNRECGNFRASCQIKNHIKQTLKKKAAEDLHSLQIKLEQM